MANRDKWEMKALGPNRVLVAGSFRPQSTSALVDADTAPAKTGWRGYSVARTSAGLYTVTFDEAWRDLLSCHVSGRDAGGNHVPCSGGDYDASAKTLQIRTYPYGSGAQKFIPLDLSSAREIASNDIQNLAAHGGVLASDSAPTLARVNAATDKALRLTWVASNVDEIAFAPVPKPPDLDASNNITVHLYAKMESTNDTPTIDCQFWDGEGDTEAGAATGALSDSLAEVTATIGAAGIAAPPGFMNLQLVPGAHGTDALYVYAAWLEYTSTNQVHALGDMADDVDNRVSFMCVFSEHPNETVAT